jgi:RHS repeat-associated protein
MRGIPASVYPFGRPPLTDFGSQRVAMQDARRITYLHTDHLGSTSVTSGAVTSTQVYYPFGSIRATTGSMPTDYGFTGQRLDSSSGLMYYGARYYDPALGRFISADTQLASPGNPQALNRYSYGLNNPVKYVDPSGSAPQYPGDPDPNNAPCGTDWCWQNRWYEAHGYEWDNGDWARSHHDPIFYDEGIIDEVLGEAGIRLQAGGPLIWDTPPFWVNWTLAEKTKVATGIAKFGLALSGGLEQLKRLLGGGATIELDFGTPWYCRGGSTPCAPPPWVPFGNGSTVYLGKTWIDENSLSWVASQTVHELGHLIDWHGNFSERWRPYAALTRYAASGGDWEKWAEAVTVFVFGNDYRSNGRLPVGPPELQVQMDRMAALLNGWY